MRVSTDAEWIFSTSICVFTDIQTWQVLLEFLQYQWREEYDTYIAISFTVLDSTQLRNRFPKQNTTGRDRGGTVEFEYDQALIIGQ